MRFPIAKYLLRLHRWTGLTVGLLIVMMATTGAAIVFRPQLEPIVNQDLLTVAACNERVPLDTLAANARAVHPAARLDYIRVLAGTDFAERMPATQIRFTDQEFVYLNPCTGAVLGQRPRYGGMLGSLEQLHRFRFIKNGSLIAGTSALLFGLLLILGGIVIWWPRAAIQSAFKFNPRLTGPARRLNQHKTVGMYASLIVLASVLTGLPQSFDWYKNGMYRITGSPLQAEAPKSAAAAESASAKRLPMELLWRRAQKLVPWPAEALLHYPGKPRDAAEIYLIGRDAPHPNARTMLFLDAYTGEVLRFIPYAASGAGHKLYFWTLSLHTGLIGGLFGQLLLLVGALSVPVLAYTGISGYLRRKFRTPADGYMALKIVRKEPAAKGISTFELAHPLGKMLPAFSAGSHIAVRISDGLVRQYSLCNDPRETHRYLIAVLRHRQSRGGSSALHDEFQEGDIIEVGEPKNHFPLAHAVKRSLLIAGGIGVTPILCFAERLANIGVDFQMHYSARSQQRAAFVDRIRQSAYADRVSFHFSDGAPEQLLDMAALLSRPDPETHLYVCGPTGFMDAVINTAREQGWPDTQVHQEYFSAEVRTYATDSEFEVKIASSGKVVRVARNKTVMAALTESGFDIPRSCEEGVCGTCLIRVLEGDPDHRDSYLTADERARNDQFLPCCSRARNALLVLDL